MPVAASDPSSVQFDVDIARLEPLRSRFTGMVRVLGRASVNVGIEGVRLDSTMSLSGLFLTMAAAPNYFQSYTGYRPLCRALHKGLQRALNF